MTGTTRTFSSNDPDAWLPYYEAVGEPGPYHHPEYLSLLEGDFEHESEYAELFVFERGDDIVYYPYIRRPVETVPYADRLSDDLADYDDIVSSWYYGGPVASPDATDEVAAEFATAFAEHCAETGIVAEFVRFDPNLENHRDFQALDPRHNRRTVPVDLTQSVDAIWEGYEGRNQRAIEQARETDLEIDREFDGEDVAAFHEIYSNAMAARDAAPHYRFSLEFFERILDSELFSLVVARHEDDVVGGFVIAHDDRHSFHYLSASNPDYWDLRVNNLMYHEVITYMKETGRRLFDFQGGRPGVFNFKKGFSPDRGDFHVGMQVHLPDVYDGLVDVANDAGIDTDSGYFPAYRVEQSN